MLTSRSTSTNCVCRVLTSGRVGPIQHIRTRTVAKYTSVTTLGRALGLVGYFNEAIRTKAREGFQGHTNDSHRCNWRKDSFNLHASIVPFSRKKRRDPGFEVESLVVVHYNYGHSSSLSVDYYHYHHHHLYYYHGSSITAQLDSFQRHRATSRGLGCFCLFDSLFF